MNDIKKADIVTSNLTIAMKKEVSLKKDIEKINVDKITETVDLSISLKIVQETKRAMRTIISMYPELNKKKSEITDDDIENLCKKIIKNEKTRLLYQNKYLEASDVEGKSPKEVSKIENEKLIEMDKKLTSYFIEALEEFLPKMISKDELQTFIDNEIDFSKLNNKMQAIGIIKKQFGNRVDPIKVREIIQNI